jgi:Histidine kinase-, DNA gyrase B-, and HSP90-like ATPase
MGEPPESRLFANALENSAAAAEGRAQELLRSSYLRTRARAALLAQDIATSLPQFTVHDNTHLDALWEMVDLVAGEEISLNGAEAYVLGIAILIHDLGLAAASYPAGPDALHAEPIWSDTLIQLLRADLGRLPTQEERESAPEAVKVAAEQEILRALHAEHAEQLASISWESDGEQYRLIEEPELRQAYGPLIGRLAHSHWWPTERLAGEFANQIGSSPVVPNGWTVDPLKLACLLRAADAIHLDARRAPPFLRALRRPEGEAADHWAFQGKLNRPYLDDDRLTFTATSPFSATETRAWWLCRDVLGRVDGWLREIDALLADVERPRFAARGISAIDEPKRLAQLIPTDGWEPVDASLHVSNVADLVRRLGGEQLYGRDVHVPLREMIQNGADAIRARRIMQSRGPEWGGITIDLDERKGRWFLTVSDSGVGMSDEVLTEALVDFGSSFWSSNDIATEFPGLLAGGFSPTGQYGIGFFSVFMLGDSVTVVSRPYRAAVDATRVLEFRDGLGGRPLLRAATESEYLDEGGTSVTIELRDNPSAPNGLLGNRQADRRRLHELCAWLCPTLDVDITVRAHGETRQVVKANDWHELSPSDLRARLGDKEADSEETLLELDECVRPLNDPGGALVGRAVVNLGRYRHRRDTSHHWPGVVSIGGLRSTSLSSLGGVFVGRSERAARDVGVPVVTLEELARWAEEQAVLLRALTKSPAEEKEIASVVTRLGGDTKDLKIAETLSGWVSAKELIGWAERHQQIVIVQDAVVHNLMRDDRPNLKLLDNVLVTDPGWPGILNTRSITHVAWPPYTGFEPGRYLGSLGDLSVRLIASAWKMKLPDLTRASSFSTDDADFSEAIGEEAGEKVTHHHIDVLRQVP